MSSHHGPSHYVDGAWIDGAGAALVVIDPGSGRQIWSGRAATDAEIERACVAARRAFDGWAMTALQDRIAVVERFRDLLRQESASMAHIISSEIGKPLWESRTEVASMAAKIDISIQAYHARSGLATNAVADGEARLRHRPHGVFAVLGPYNFPGHLPNGHIVPALIAGNAIVFKPSEHAPQTAIRTVELWERAGLPPGVLNLVNGNGETGAMVCRQPQLDGVLFTGSYRTGAAIHRHFAGQPGKMLALEMGGNNALVVWDVANTDAAVHHAILSAFVSAGQRCTCARRLIVEDSPRGWAFLARLVKVAAGIRVGVHDAQPEPFMGPVVSARVAAGLIQAQADMLAQGGVALLPMTYLQPGTGLVSAGIVDVTDAREVADEEWFGPLLQVIRVPDFDTAIARANATEYGLAAALLSDDECLWRQFASRARAGIVNWNRPTTGAASSAPFGGIGKSGNHRPSAYYAADYCAYPVASIENRQLELPPQLSPGLSL